MGKDAEFTAEELNYIRTMFMPEHPEVLKITKASQLGPMVGLFVDNRDEAIRDGEEWPLDHSITEKVFAYHGIPKDTNYKTFNAKYVKALKDKVAA